MILFVCNCQTCDLNDHNFIQVYRKTCAQHAMSIREIQNFVNLFKQYWWRMFNNPLYYLIIFNNLLLSSRWWLFFVLYRNSTSGVLFQLLRQCDGRIKSILCNIMYFINKGGLVLNDKMYFDLFHPPWYCRFYIMSKTVIVNHTYVW